MGGAFFNREKLLTPEMIKNNDQAISNLAARKRIPASNGKSIEVSEQLLRDTLDQQTRMLDNAKKLFQ